MLKTWLMLCVFVVGGCASFGDSDEKKMQKELKITDSSQEEKPKVASQSQDGLVDYTFDKQPNKVEWNACIADGAKNAVLVVPAGELAAGDASFCSTWLAQTFLSAGYSVLGVNRPGLGRSTGTGDFSGPQSQAAVVAAASAAKGVKGLKPIVGVWSASAGVPAAAFAAKKISGLRWVVFGSGIYDAEVTMNTTQDKSLKSAMTSAVTGEDGYEVRSIAWDNSGLPKKVILYHGKNDNAVYPAQAESFRDSLATAEYDVSLQVIDGVGHDIAPGHHRQILEIVLRSLQ